MGMWTLEVVVHIEPAARLAGIQHAYLDHGLLISAERQRLGQYFCTLGSISSLHARMPPARFTTCE